jgi:DNA-binding Lrp family transcriptional regulator
LCFLLSYPSDWDLSISWISQTLGIGEVSVRSSIKELEEIGYITRERRTNSKNQFIGWEYNVSPCQELKDAENEPENPPRRENSDVGTTPTLGKPRHRDNLDVGGTSMYTKEDQISKQDQIPKEDHTKRARAKKQFTAQELEPFRLVWNRDKATQWAACDVLNSERVKSFNKLILDEGELALELFEKAIAFIKTEKWWLEKRISIDMLIRPSKGHIRAYAERYLATPSGQTVQNLDIKKAVELQERDRRLSLLEDV